MSDTGDSTGPRPLPRFAAIPAEAPPAPPPATPGDARDRLRRHLAAARGRVWAIVDGARALPLALVGRLLGADVFTLFQGDDAEELADAGPCVFAIDDPARFADHFGLRVGQSAGILAVTGDVAVPEMLSHLRRVFVVRDETRQEFFFRFYDPRVLRPFLPTCRPDELADLFGPSAELIAERADGAGFESFRRTASGELETVDLGPPGAA